MAGNDYIAAYYQRIKNGNVRVGRWVRLAYEYIIHGLEKKLFALDLVEANTAVDWIESHCFHTEGPLAPSPFKMELWQKAFVSVIFGIKDLKGNRQFREAVLIVARKNGKSKLGASIADYVFQHAGYGTRVYCLAPKLEQADIIYNDVWQMIQLDPEWQELRDTIQNERDEHNKRVNEDSMLARHRQTDLCIPGANSTIKKIAFSAKKSDGFNPSLTICDEIASWEGDKGLKQYEVMKSAMGARPDGLLLSCSTSGYINDSIYDEIIKRSTRFLMGDSKETRLFPALYMIDDVEKWNDIEELQKSNPNLGVSVSIDYLLEEIAIAEGSLSKKGEFITKYDCIKQNSSMAWLDVPVVEKATGTHIDLEDFRDTYAVAGIDLSRTTDLTSCCVVIEREGVLNVISKFFLPSETIQQATERDGVPYQIYVERGILQLSGDNFIDYHDCFNWFADLVQRYQIYPLMIGYDRYSAQYLIQDLKAFGNRVDDVFQGFNLWPVIQELEGLLKDGKINIGDNDLLKAHLLNVAVKMDNQRGRGKIEKINATSHIDGAAALLDALTVRQKWYAEIGEQLQNK